MGDTDRVWPSVSVTVLAYRSGATSTGCIQSVLAQDYPGTVEVLVREQGGDDDELAALEAVAASSPDRVHLERGDNLGFCGGHNRLLAQARGDLVLLLNADARLEPDFLRAAVPAFDAPSVAAVQGLVLLDGHATPTIDTTGLLPGRNRRIVARDHGRPWASDRAAEEIWGVDGAVALFRAAALVDAAESDGQVLAEDFGSYKEDVELAWRLRRLGWQAWFVPEAVAWHHRGSKEAAGATARQRATGHRKRSALSDINGFVNLRLAQVRHERRAQLWADRGPWLRREVGAWILRLQSPRRLLSVLRSLFAGVPAAWRWRRSFAPKVRVVDDDRWFS